MRRVAAEGRDVYEYYFTKDNGYLGSSHAGEMPYCYGNLDKHTSRYDESDFALSKTMQKYRLNFIKTGTPNGEELPKWEMFNDDRTKVLEFGEKVAMITDPNIELYKIIDKYRAEK